MARSSETKYVNDTRALVGQRQVPRLLAKEYWEGPLEVLVGLAFWNSSAPQLSNPTIEITVRTATEHS
jgi:hypothetical protein